MTVKEKEELFAEIFAIRSGLSYVNEKQDKICELNAEIADYNRKIEEARKEIEKQKEENKRLSKSLNYSGVRLSSEEKSINDYHKNNAKYVVSFIFNSLFLVAGILLISLIKNERDALYQLLEGVGIFLSFLIFVINFIKIVREIADNIHWILKQKDSLNTEEERYNSIWDDIKTSSQKIARLEKDLDILINESPEKENKQQIDVLYEEGCNMLEVLEETHGNIIHPADWYYLDLIIHYIETGRADTLKDALLLADKQAQTDQICNAIAIATNYICNIFTREIRNLGNYLEYKFSNIESQLNKMNKSIDNVNRKNSLILDELDLQKSLINNIEKSSNELAETANSLSKDLTKFSARVIEHIEEEEEEEDY